MLGSLLAILVLGVAAALYWRLRSGIAAFEEQLRHPKGWLQADARIDEALLVADRHLQNARAGANVRLQFGTSGCLTMIRRRPRDGDSGYLARWEFWRPDSDLARALLDAGADRVDKPQGDMLELVFSDDYPFFRSAMETVFVGRPVETGNMHLTWNA